MITPNKYSAIRGKITIINNYVVVQSPPPSEGAGGRCYFPVLRKLARGYRNISPTDLWRGINILIMLILFLYLMERNKESHRQYGTKIFLSK